MSKNSFAAYKPIMGRKQGEGTNNNTQNGNIIVEYDVLRVIAILLVVIGHCDYFMIKTAYGGVDYSQLFITGALEATKTLNKVSGFGGWIYLFHMPLFFMLSGALYSVVRTNSKKYENFEELLLSKTKRLIIPYIFCGLMFMIPIKYFTHFYTTKNLGNAIFYGLIEGKDSGHLWFLATLFWIFLIFNLLERYVFVHNKYLIYILIFVLTFFPSFFPISMCGLDNVPSYLPYFAVGYIFEHGRRKLNTWFQKHLVIYTCLLAAIGTGIYLLYRFYNSYDVKNTWLCIFLLFLVRISIALIVYVLSFLLSKSSMFINCRLFRLLTKYSMEIYLYHDPLNYVILYLLYATGTITIINREFGALFFVFIRTLGVAFTSILISKIANMIKKSSRSKTVMKVAKTAICCIVVLAFCNVVYNADNNIKQNYDAYTPINFFKTAYITDQNWIGGISKVTSTLCLRNSDPMRKSLIDAEYIKSGHTMIKIEKIELYDNKWIHIICPQDTDLTAFAYPNVIEVIQ